MTFDQEMLIPNMTQLTCAKVNDLGAEQVAGGPRFPVP